MRDYGVFNVLLAVMGYISLLSCMGLPSIFQRFLPEFSEEKRLGAAKKLIRDGLFSRLALVVGLVIIAVLLANIIGGLFQIKGFFNYFAVFSIAIILYCEAQLLGTALTSLFLYREFIVSQVVYTLIRALVLYGLLRSGAGLAGVLAGEVFCYSFQLLLEVFYYGRYSRLHPSELKEEFPFKRLLRFGGYSYFNEMGSEVLNVSTDFFIISAFLGPQAVGLYAFANRLMSNLTRILPHSLLGDVVRPTFYARYVRSGDKKDLTAMFNLVTKLVAFILFPLAVGVFVLGDKLIIYFFHPKYLSSLSVLWIVGFFTAVNTFDFPLGLISHAIEKPEINLYSKVFAIYNIILDLIVVRPFGIVGVALATSSAILFKNLFVFFWVRQHVDLALDWSSLTRIVLNAAIMGLIVYSLRGFVTNIWTFLLVVTAGASVYFLIAGLNKSFSVNERTVLNRVLPRPVFVF